MLEKDPEEEEVDENEEWAVRACNGGKEGNSDGPPDDKSGADWWRRWIADGSGPGDVVDAEADEVKVDIPVAGIDCRVATVFLGMTSPLQTEQTDPDPRTDPIPDPSNADRFADLLGWYR